MNFKIKKTIVFFGNEGCGKDFLFKHLSKQDSFKYKKENPVANYCECLANIGAFEYRVVNLPFLNINSKKVIDVNLFFFVKKFIEQKSDLFCWFVDKLSEEEFLISKSFFKKLLIKNKCLIINREIQENNEREKYFALGTNKTLYLPINSNIKLHRLASFLEETIPYSSLEKEEQKEKMITEEIKNSGTVVTIIGIPNSGKSTLMNSLLKDDRSLVTPEEGTTIEPVFANYSSKNFSFEVVDTKGIKKADEMEFNLLKRTNFFIVVIDVTTSLTKQLLKITSLGIKFNKPSLVVINKIDLISKAELIKKRAELQFRLKKIGPSAITTSCFIKHQGIASIKKEISDILFQSKRTFNKKKLLSIIGDINKMSKAKIYSIQQKTNFNELCHTFIILVSDPSAVDLSQRRCISRLLREYLELKNIPISLFIKKTKRIFYKHK